MIRLIEAKVSIANSGLEIKTILRNLLHQILFLGIVFLSLCLIVINLIKEDISQKGDPATALNNHTSYALKTTVMIPKDKISDLKTFQWGSRRLMLKNISTLLYPDI